MTISDAVRRATPERHTGTEEELGEYAEKMAPGRSADQLRGVLGDDVLAMLMQGADWCSWLDRSSGCSRPVSTSRGVPATRWAG
ncbi:hypothetical protein ACH4XT_36835 [Streptomyces avidinii]|uniref:hypothetical protein n=1 Tax=Streptomyces avidinii TaxID=1895 RepID=UPI0037A6C103